MEEPDGFAEFVVARRDAFVCTARWWIAATAGVVTTLVSGGLIVGGGVLMNGTAGTASLPRCSGSIGEAMPPAARQGANLQMVPGLPKAAIVCDYHDDIPPAIPGARPSTIRLIGHRTLTGEDLEKVVASLNSPMYPGGLLVCFDVRTPGPATALVVSFRYESGADVSVKIVLNGCSEVTNGALDGNYGNGVVPPVIAGLAMPAG